MIPCYVARSLLHVKTMDFVLIIKEGMIELLKCLNIH